MYCSGSSDSEGDSGGGDNEDPTIRHHTTFSPTLFPPNYYRLVAVTVTYLRNYYLQLHQKCNSRKNLAVAVLVSLSSATSKGKGNKMGPGWVAGGG